MRPAVSVIVPVLNGAATLPGLLQSLERQTYGGAWEVVVADNGSSDRSRDLLSGWSGRLPGLRWVDASGRRGVSHARNVGSRGARGRLLAFIDQDDEADPGWLGALVEAAGPGGFVAGRCDFRRLNHPIVRAWSPEPPRDRLPHAHLLPYAIGTNLAVDADVLRRVGGWDESLRHGGEDVELSLRLQMAAHALTFVPDAVVHKRRRQTLGGLARQQFLNGAASVGVYRRFRSHLRPQAPWASLRAWGHILLTSGDLLRSPEWRGHWVAIAARRLGRLVGSVRERVFYI